MAGHWAPRLLIVTLALLMVSTAGGEEPELLGDLTRMAAAGEWAGLSERSAALGKRLARNAHRDPSTYGEIATYRALAHFHLGQTREATWDWQVALNLASDLAIAEMAKHPDAADGFATTGVPLIQLDRDPDVRPARVTKMTRPTILTVSDARRRPAAFGVRLIVGVDGVPHSPQVVGEVRDEGDRVYSALEALREWRFEPATAGGVPVEFATSINLDLGSAGKRPRSGARRF
jgi:hypothetical protein